MDDLTGNNLSTNEFLDIDAMISEARGRIERTETGNWIGSIKYMLWNATGLMANLDRIVRRMETEDVLFGFIVETWLHPERAIPKVCRDTSAVCVVHPVGYERGKNGISIIVNPRMKKHPLLNDFQVLARDTVNGTFIYVQLGNIKILCIYNPPSQPEEIDTWLEEILLKCRANTLEEIVILGDFNARCREWGDHYANSKGRILNRWIEANGLQRVDTGPEPTYVSGTGNSIVDHVFTNVNGISGTVSSPVSNVAGHRPIIGSINITARQDIPEIKYERIKLEKLKDQDSRDRLNSRMTTTIQPFLHRLRPFIATEAHLLLDSGSKQNIVDEFDKLLMECILKPSKEILGVKIAGKKQIVHEELTSPDLLILEAALATGTDLVANAELFKRASLELQRLKNVKFDLFSNELSSMKASDMMKVTSSMITNRKKQQIALNSSDESLEIYKSHFKQMNTNNLPAPRTTTEPIILQLPSLPLITELKSYISASSLMIILKRMSSNKSPGSSGLTYDILKVAPMQVMEGISEFFELITILNCVPSSWKRALIVPVPKKGDLNLIKNYRPISLTEPLRKLMEHCLLKYVNLKVGPSFLTQGGLRSNHCCNDMVLVLHEAASKYKSELHTAFLDIKAAYDSVDRRILWRRCRNRGLPYDAVELLKEFFDHNSGQVVVGGKRSQAFHIESGVLQGSVLSPCLYSIFLDDLAYELSKHSKVQIGGALINCTLYADDIALFSTDPLALQTLLKKCEDHARANRYRFSVAKCEVISTSDNIFQIEDQQLPRTERFKYLGVEIKQNGIDYMNFVKRRCEDAVLSANRLIGMGMNVGGFSPAACSILYKVFIRPKIEASMCILAPLKKISQLLERTQCGILRRILRAGKTSSGQIIRSILQMPTMAHRIKWLRTRYVRRFLTILEDQHILKLSSQGNSSWINRKLSREIYPPEVDKQTAWQQDLEATHARTREITCDQLSLTPSRHLPWFLRIKCPQSVRRPIVNWILKRYPGRDPPTCANCLEHRATQEHIATCNNLFESDLPLVPCRFRPEAALSLPQPENSFQALLLIAKRIATAVQRSIPDFDFTVLHS